MRRWTIAKVGVLLGAMLLAAPARADEVEEARAAFRAGADAAKNAQWRDALAHFQRSAALRPHAATSYNLGYCELMLGHPTRARRFLTRALAEDQQRSGELGELRPSATQHLATAEAAVAHVALKASSGTTILVDEKPLEFESAGPPPTLSAGTREVGPAERLPAGSVEIVLDPGPHRIVTRREGSSAPDTVDVTTESGKVLALDVVRPAFVAPPFDLGPQKKGAIVLASLGVGSLALGGILAGVAASTWSAAQDACPEPDYCPDDTGPDRANAARDMATVATIALAVGGASVAGGIVLWFSAPNPFLQDKVRGSVAVATDGRAIAMRLRW